MATDVPLFSVDSDSSSIVAGLAKIVLRRRCSRPFVMRVITKEPETPAHPQASFGRNQPRVSSPRHHHLRHPRQSTTVAVAGAGTNFMHSVGWCVVGLVSNGGGVGDWGSCE